MNNEQAIKAAIDAGVPVPFEALLKQKADGEDVEHTRWHQDIVGGKTYIHAHVIGRGHKPIVE